MRIAALEQAARVLRDGIEEHFEADRRTGNPHRGEDAGMDFAELGGEGECLTEAKEVVGLIGEADETAGETADAALQTDGLFAFFFEL